ncbi:MAG: hypothetical protein KJN60_00125 [Boseongicola sp.]|nr:hypothetical protein [Boseongicola sp.]
MGYRPRRDITTTTVRVVVGDHYDVVNLRNVSSGGARIDAVFDAEVGDPLTIQIRDRSFVGRIAWASDVATGVAFSKSLRPAELSIFTGRPDRTLTPARARVGFSGHVAFRR